MIRCLNDSAARKPHLEDSLEKKTMYLKNKHVYVSPTSSLQSEKLDSSTTSHEDSLRSVKSCISINMQAKNDASLGTSGYLVDSTMSDCNEQSNLTRDSNFVCEDCINVLDTMFLYQIVKMFMNIV